MFGIYRYVLINFIVLTHLWRGLVNWSGVYAVVAFYVLSGYLIVLVLKEKYDFSFIGLRRFFINRILRIYPIYWVLLLIVILIFLFYPQLTTLTGETVYLPHSISEWVSNIFIIGLKTPALRLLTEIPPARLMPVRFIGYILILYLISPLLVRKRWLTLLWFAGNLSYNIYMIWQNYDILARYNSFWSASFFFSTGALIYYFKDRLQKIFPTWTLFLSLPLFLGNIIMAKQLWPDPYLHGMYTSLILSIFVLIGLSQIKLATVSTRIKKIDKFFGDLSYPIFLNHALVAIILVKFVFDGKIPKSGNLFYYSLPFINLFAFLIYWSIDKRFEKTKEKIRSNINFKQSK